MEQGIGKNPLAQESKTAEVGVEVVGSIGLAEELLKEKGTLKPHNAWFGISTREKVYPDSMVLDFARWGSKNSNNFLIVVADESVIPHNAIALSNKRLTYDQMPEMMDEATKLAEKRKEKLKELIHNEGLTNVEVKLWNEILEELSVNKDSWYFFHTGMQLLDKERYTNEEFEKKLREIANAKVGSELKRARKRKGRLSEIPIWGYISGFSNEVENVTIDAMINSGDPITKAWGEKQRNAKNKFGSEYVEFAAATYVKEEIFATWAQAVIGNYPIKVGPPWERVYDELTLNLIREGKPIEIEGAKFGAVYLKKTQNP